MDALDRWLRDDLDDEEPGRAEDEPVRDVWLAVDELAAKRARMTVAELRARQARARMGR